MRDVEVYGCWVGIAALAAVGLVLLLLPCAGMFGPWNELSRGGILAVIAGIVMILFVLGFVMARWRQAVISKMTLE